MRFPFPLGGASFEEKDRYERARKALGRLTGDGGFPEDAASLIRRTFDVFAQMCAGVSLSSSRLLQNVFPDRAHPDDLLPVHERWMRIPRDALATVEQRWANLLRARRTPAGSRIWDVKARLEEVLGAGTVTPRYNLAATLDAAGLPRSLMFVIAYEVPLAAILTIGQVQRLDGIIRQYKGITINGAVTRAVARGFLCDDDQSMTDRDVLDG